MKPLKKTCFDHHTIPAVEVFVCPDKSLGIDLRSDCIDNDVVHGAWAVAEVNYLANSPREIDLVKKAACIELSEDVSRKQVFQQTLPPAGVFVKVEPSNSGQESLNPPGLEIALSAIFLSDVCIDCVPERPIDCYRSTQ